MKITSFLTVLFLTASQLGAQDTLSASSHDTLLFHKVLGGHDAAVESLTYSKDGSLFATGSWDRKARLYRVDSLKNYSFLRSFDFHHAAITCLDISADNKYIAIGSKDFTFSVYEVETGKLRFVSRDHTNAISQLFFDPSSTFLITASSDGTARVYRVQDFEQAKPNSLVLKYTSKINGAQLSPSKGKFLLACDDAKVVQVNLKGAVSAAFIGHQARVTCLDVSHSNKFIASGSDDKTIRIWDVKTRQARFVLEGHGWNVTSVHFSKDDRYLISSCNNGEVKIWDLQTGKEWGNVPTLGTNARQAMFAPNMQTVAVASLQAKPPFGAILYHSPLKVEVPQKPGKGNPQKGGKPLPGKPVSKTNTKTGAKPKGNTPPN